MAADTLPTLAAGSSGRKRKNRGAAERATAKRAAAAAGLSVVTDTVAPGTFALQPVGAQPPRKLKPGELKLPKVLRDGAVLHLPDGEKYAQKRNIPPSSIAGKSALEALLAPKAGAGQANVYVAGVDYTYDDDDNGPGGIGMELYGDRVKGPSRHRRRRLKQHENWMNLLRSSLLELYLLRKYTPAPVARNAQDPATCQCLSARFQEVTLADWDGFEVTYIRICLCSPAAEQLMALGYFPCAPLSPSMAFNMALLDFISIHSVQVAPNSTAWSHTLETFWSRKGVPAKLHGRLRKRLAMALTWYQVLDNQAEAYVNRARDGTAVIPRPSSGSATMEDEREDEQDDGADGHEGERPGKRRRVYVGPRDEAHAAAASQAAAPAPMPSLESAGDALGSTTNSTTPDAATTEPAPSEEDGRARPSDRLRRICPLCFGAGRPGLQFSEADVIICADGNFSQKRRKCASADPPLEYMDGRFVEVDAVGAMEHELGEKRKGKPRRTRKRKNKLVVAEEVLDECERSFTAAQEKVAKASTTYYADTGLMALLCRHDCVLLVANMTTPGERQHYVLALLRKLGEELPRAWRIGLLYDIACQISRSVDKWGLLEELADRLVYAVSVFHAYGHQWACQVVYRPRKREGFGLTDGEGCERFWSSIRHLIPGLRVSGYSRRLFVLNRQMDAISESSRWNVAAWLRRRYAEVVRRSDEAGLVVAACGVAEGVLEEQWRAQVSAQVQKPPRQSSSGADKIIDEILLTMGEEDDLRTESKEIQRALRKSHKMDATEIEDLRRRKDAVERETEAARKRIANLNESLGTEHCRRLETMKGDAYLRARVNARALRAAIRHALQAHKFERRKLERAYRNQILHAKDHAQTRDLVHRREKTITGQVKKYNAQVEHMALLARQGKKPSARTPLPRKLDSKKLFRLDVDDDIWQEDPGLGPQDEGDLPRWQTEDDVKRGIVGMLAMRRCKEERERVQAEVAALGKWWVEEEENLRDFQESVSGWSGVAECAERRMLTHKRLRETWLVDLASYPRLLQLFNGERSTEERHHEVVDDDVEVTRHSEEGDVDSDDASDTYSSVDDEDEPIADLMDDLERIAGDLDPEDDLAEEVGQVVGPEGSGTSKLEIDTSKLSAVSASATSAAPAPTPVRSAPTAPAAKASEVIDADALSDGEVPIRPATKRARYVAGSFFCDEIDLARIVHRQEWLSGDGLAVFVKGRLLRSGLQDISVVHPRVLHDVNEYTRHLDEDAKKADSYLTPIVKAMSELVCPSLARKWLILGHIVSPPHWTLLEIRWREEEIRFYDSFARKGGYAVKLEESVRAFIELCAQHFALQVDPTSFEWINEQRGVRQSNWYDCGPLAAADAASLLEGDIPSSKTEKAMGDWRETMAQEIMALEERVKGKAKKK